MRIFITHIVPRDKVTEYNMSFAACNFSYNLIGGGIFDTVYSILPTFVKGEVEAFDGLIYSRLRKCKGMLYRLAPIMECFSAFGKIPRKASVWYYNCTTLNVTLMILLKLFKPSVKQNIIQLDYTPSDSFFARFCLRIANSLNGTICLAPSPLFTCLNIACLPGVVPDNYPEQPKVSQTNGEFLISGALGYNISMLSMLLKAFAKMPDKTLHITGKAPDTDLLKRYTDNYTNIIYHGVLPYDKYIELMHSVPFMLSTRNPDAAENQCNFPSKIIEALLHNRIIISTIHYEQLDGIRYFEVPADIDGFTDSINSICHKSKEELLTYANQSNLVRERFSTKVWEATMKKIENQDYA